MSMTYDGFDRQTRWTFPSKTTPGQVNAADYEAYGYDAVGNRTSFRKRDGSTLTYTYDNLDRVTVKTVPSRVGLPATHSRSVYSGYDVRGLQTYCAHATKLSKRYRYYLTHPKKLTKDRPPTVRVPAHEMEQLVTEALTKFLSDQSALMTAACNADAEALQELFNRAANGVRMLQGSQSDARQVLDDWDVNINVARTSFEVTLQLTERVSHTLTGRFDKVRRGVDVKLQAAPPDTETIERDEQLVATLAEAYVLRQRALANPEMELEAIAAERGMGVRRLKRLLKLSYLEPEVVSGVLEGGVRALNVAEFE